MPALTLGPIEGCKITSKSIKRNDFMADYIFVIGDPLLLLFFCKKQVL